jgi:hypothetical protein
MTQFTFFLQLFNFCWLWTLSHGDFKFVGLYENKHGHPDFNKNWFLGEAPIIIQTMVIAIFSP